MVAAEDIAVEVARQVMVHQVVEEEVIGGDSNGFSGGYGSSRGGYGGASSSGENISAILQLLQSILSRLSALEEKVDRFINFYDQSVQRDVLMLSSPGVRGDVSMPSSQSVRGDVSMQSAQGQNEVYMHSPSP
uniref:Uncharacterized protein n=1 Tax=Panagrolaimus superbus TaxID=310955 RepID=A0A914YTD9_9BILA